MAMLRLVPSSGNPIEVAQDAVLIGRDPTCDLVLSDGSVSRRHARIERRGPQWFVVDQGSANGTFLDSQRVTDGAMRNGQELRFGSVAYRVEVTASTDTADLMPGATIVQAAPPEPPRRPSAPPPPPPSAAPSARVAAARPLVPRAQTPKKHGPLFWTLAGCCGCITLLALAAGAFFGGIFFMTKGASDAVDQQLRDLRKGDIAAAYGRMSQDYRNRASEADFGAFVQEHVTLRSNKDYSFSSRAVHNQTARLSGVLTATSGEKEAVSFALIKEEGTWKIALIDFSGPS
jgi:hypothetical protein